MQRACRVLLFEDINSTENGTKSLSSPFQRFQGLVLVCEDVVYTLDNGLRKIITHGIVARRWNSLEMRECPIGGLIL